MGRFATASRFRLVPPILLNCRKEAVPVQWFKHELMNAAIVVALDMRSSSLIFDDLEATQNLDRLGGFLSSMKHFLADELQMARGLQFAPHKFIGDAWILLFFPQTPGDELLLGLRDFCVCYDREYERQLLPNLTTPPEVTGMAFGIDAGPLFKTTIFGNKEYLARALNVADRLQAHAKKLPGRFNVLVSATAFEKYFGAPGFDATPMTRKLLGIRHAQRFRCVQVDLNRPATLGGIANAVADL